MEKEIIQIEFEGKRIVADILPAGIQPAVLFMHGAGFSNRSIFNKFREMLAEKGISSCAFDFVGYGETGGAVEESSLKSRTAQAQRVIQEANLKQPLKIVAGSMAGYNAIKLTELFNVDTLILSAPAVYGREAYEVSFGEEFSRIIRKSKSWEDTDAWEILNNFKGRLLILSGEKDDVIPSEVIQKIYDSSSHAYTRELFTVPNAPHRLTVYLEENLNEMNQVIKKVIEVL